MFRIQTVHPMSAHVTQKSRSMQYAVCTHGPCTVYARSRVHASAHGQCMDHVCVNRVWSDHCVPTVHGPCIDRDLFVFRRWMDLLAPYTEDCMVKNNLLT